MEKLSLRKENLNATESDLDYLQNQHSTPIRSRNSTENNEEYYSPIFSQYTQEECNNIDVMWDWNSPQSKPRIRKQRRITVQQSPKLLVRRQPSNNQIPVFDKLKEELETLREQIITICPETNNTLASDNKNKELDIQTTSNLSDLEDVFNDSMDEQLIRCSQEVENILTKPEEDTPNHKPFKFTDDSLFFEKNVNGNTSEFQFKSNHFQSDKIDKRSTFGVKNATIDRIVSKYLDTNKNKIADDSFDCLLETLNDEDLPINTDSCNRNVTETTKQIGEKDVSSRTIVKESPIKCLPEEIEKKRLQALAKLEAKKRHEVTDQDDSPIKCSPEEIEKKRLQAFAKLEAKKKYEVIQHDVSPVKCSLQEAKKKRLQTLPELKTQTSNDITEQDDSPVKCSPEEIENKRLQALAKLEAKKRQEIIEQKRQEALKRLEITKKKRALQSLTVLPCK